LQIGDGASTGTLAGSVSNGGSLVFDRAGTSSFGGTITGAGELVKRGAGVLAFSGANNSTAQTDIQDGTLELSGSINGDIRVRAAGTFDVSHLVGGNFNVAAGQRLSNDGAVNGSLSVAGVLEGTGSVQGNVTTSTGGELAAGTGGIGTLTIEGELTLGGGSKLTSEIGGASSLNLTDLIVASSVTLSGAGGGVTLNLSLVSGFNVTSSGQLFFLVSNTGNDPVAGSFTNPTTTMSFGADYGGGTYTVLNDPVGEHDARFAISYDADLAGGTFHGGNDIALIAVPEPSSAVTLALGAGSLLGLRRFRSRRRTAGV
jgi:autotransporter-associated beta strand protein